LLVVILDQKGFTLEHGTALCLPKEILTRLDLICEARTQFNFLWRLRVGNCAMLRRKTLLGWGMMRAVIFMLLLKH